MLLYTVAAGIFTLVPTFYIPAAYKKVFYQVRCGAVWFRPSCLSVSNVCICLCLSDVCTRWNYGLTPLLPSID